jgi:chromosome partitioning protein
MRIVSVANQKGGCGKTTVSVNLAAALSKLGARVLLVDNDPQGHATLALGVSRGQFTLSTRDLYLTSDMMVEDVRLELRERLHLIPADVDLSTVEQSLDGAERRVRRLLERFTLSDMPYDLVIIDNPPNVGLLTFNALMASGEAIVPVDPGSLTLDAVDRFRETLDILADERGHRVKMHVLPSCFDVRTRYARELLEEIDRLYPGERLATLLHQTVRLKEAAAAGEAIDSFDATSRGAKDFDELAHEIYSLAADVHVEDPVRAGELLMGPNPRRAAGLVRLNASFPDAESVAVTGDFTDWSVQGMPLKTRDDGVWELELDVEPGCYEYKFIVDGVWKVDPENPERVRNNYGQLNSILLVPSAGEV